MAPLLEVPDHDMLAAMALELVVHVEPWVATIRAAAADGLIAEMTWDRVAASVTVVVLRGDEARGDEALVRIEREAVVSVQVTTSKAGMHFDAVLAAEELGGTLTINIGPTVVVRDALLRK